MKNFKAINELDFIDIENEVKASIKSQCENDEVESAEEKWIKEIKLYDPCKCFYENFEDGSTQKYLLVSVSNFGRLDIERKIPDQFSKIVVDINKMEEYSTPEFFVVDYDSFFGTRLTSFIKYNSDFISCDERVFLEALIIKYRGFGYMPFFWSKEVIHRELGIKKDRASRIIKKFKELGILTTEVKKSLLDGRPQQITYFDLNSEKIIELLPKMFGDRDDDGFEQELKQYLNYTKKPTAPSKVLL